MVRESSTGAGTVLGRGKAGTGMLKSFSQLASSRKVADDNLMNTGLETSCATAPGRRARGERGRHVQEESDASLISVGILGNILLK